jgi:tetratricopeptide (TPR) repeat protein
MAKSSARKRASEEKARRVSQKRAKSAAKRPSSLKSRRSSPKTSPHLRHAGERAGRAKPLTRTAADNRSVAAPAAPTQPPPKPARLLRESKSTAAALGLLEKAIKLIYQKEFKKARHELESLMAEHSSESEITARAQSYLQICRREGAVRPKAVPTIDELYSVGVLEHNRGNYNAAIACFRQCLEKRSSADYVLYSLAASLALKGDGFAALENLKKAIELNEDNRVYAKNDSDFTALYSEPGFAVLVGMNSGPASELPRT